MTVRHCPVFSPTGGRYMTIIPYDVTCAVCGVVFCDCEGGSVWDETTAHVHADDHIGVCPPCSNRLDKRHPTVFGNDEAREILWPEGAR